MNTPAPDYEWPDWLPQPDLHNLPEAETIDGLRLTLALMADDGLGQREVVLLRYDPALIPDREHIARLLREHADYVTRDDPGP